MNTNNTATKTKKTNGKTAFWAARKAADKVRCAPRTNVTRKDGMRI
ncbi:MAG: hypothetical protein WC563_15980 [Brevundimonas sp.]